MSPRRSRPELGDATPAVLADAIVAVVGATASERGDAADPATERAALALLFLRMAEARGLEPPGRVARVAQADGEAAALARDAGELAERLGSPLLGTLGAADPPRVRALAAAWVDGVLAPAIARAPARLLGDVAERLVAERGRGPRRAYGVYYTPQAIARRLVEATVAPVLAEAGAGRRVTVLDPACGAGAFLLEAYERLLAAVEAAPSFPSASTRRVALTALRGIDRDPVAVDLAALSLLLRAAEGLPDPSRSAATLAAAARAGLRVGDTLLGPDGAAGGAAPVRGWLGSLEVDPEGLDVVVGNPPWGQKGAAAAPSRRRALAARYPSSAGLFDLFRPFVEAGIRLTRPGGRFGMVLPDIVLLKDYEATRRLLLEELTLGPIEWLGAAFPGAAIDVVTIAGRRAPAPAQHRVSVAVNDGPRPLVHRPAQRDFAAHPRAVLNLRLTDERRALLARLQAGLRLGDHFAAHEGVHSGNLRAELFVAERLDETCRELLFGRDELAPYAIRWDGRWLRVGAVPARRTRDRYANLGRPEWHERPKVVVRRTGDRVLAAVDEAGRWASNNFFVVAPTHPAPPLGLHGLAAILNAPVSTWLFRALVPREGRAFAELKIRDLHELRLPPPGAGEAARLDALGLARARASDDLERARLDGAIDQAVRAAFGIDDALARAAGLPLTAAPAAGVRAPGGRTAS